jgi:molecular chaperone GrpE (heat shock protein)
MSVMIDEQQARPTQGRVGLSGDRQDELKAELKEELRAEFRAQLDEVRARAREELDEVEARARAQVRAELLESIDKIGLVYYFAHNFFLLSLRKPVCTLLK